MDHMYSRLVADGLAVPDAMRLGMLHLALGSSPGGGKWRHPKYWAGFVVVGARTHLPLVVFPSGDNE